MKVYLEKKKRSDTSKHIAILCAAKHRDIPSKEIIISLHQIMATASDLLLCTIKQNGNRNFTKHSDDLVSEDRRHLYL